MTDGQIKMLLNLGGDEAKLLLRNGEYRLYRTIQKKMVKLIREYDVQLPLSCLQFFYYNNGRSRQN
jgi:hypothetical protein